MNALRTIQILLLSLVLGVAFNACTKQESDGHDHAAEAAEVYTCPMHPSVISDRPGACPVCNMALVKKSAAQEMSAEEAAMLHTVSLSPTQRIMANVAVSPVARKSMSKQISAVGVVDFAEPMQSVVTARFRGRIEKLNVSFTGENVRKGQALFELYSPDLVSAQQDYLIALDALTRAQTLGNSSNEEVQQRLVASIRERLRIHYGLTLEQLRELEETKKVRSTATFYAPISGTVISKQIVEGQYVDEGTTFYSIADLSRVWVYLEVYEGDIRFVKTGQAVDITTEAYPNEQFRGRVTFIDPVMNPETRTVRVRTEFPNTGGNLKPQMYVKAALSLPQKEALAVPVHAVVQTGKRNVVWVELKENQFEPREVTLGARTDGWYEIVSGLSEGEMVVTTGGYLLDSESQLQMPGGMAGHAHDGEAGGQKSEVGGQKAEVGGQKAEVRGQKSEVGGQKSEAGQSSVREIKITVDYEYIPATVHVKKGEKVRLLFYKKEDSECTNEVVFKDLNIRKKLPAFKTTAIEITPKKTGEFGFACGMDMIHGRLVVE